jgi:hypothetical protein
VRMKVMVNLWPVAFAMRCRVLVEEHRSRSASRFFENQILTGEPIPRSNERGSIEASDQGRGHVRRDYSPRSNERGSN